MAEVGAWAYPVIMLVMVVLVRLGRREPWGPMEWMRLGALCAFLGIAAAVQVKLAMLGLTGSPVAFASGAVSLLGMGMLCALYLYERWELRGVPEHGGSAAS